MYSTAPNYASKIAFKQEKRHSIDMRNVAAIVMAGGQGTRLKPLTNYRCKPALSYGGNYRLIDFPISNAINSGCNKIYVLTQYLSHTLHKHLLAAYPQSPCLTSTVEMMPAEEKVTGASWFKGTADAIRHHGDYFQELDTEFFLILSGDQLYQLDFRNMVQFAQETEADVVVACLPVKEEEARRMGVMQVDKGRIITSFFEKPQTKRDLSKMKLPALDENSVANRSKSKDGDSTYLGSMGIYLFRRKALFDLLLDDTREDFGKHLIPTQVKKGNIAAYIHQGYWEDIGTIDSYYSANLALTAQNSPINCYNEAWPIFGHKKAIPASVITNTLIKSSIVCEGGIIEADEISGSLIGPRMRIGKGTTLLDSYLIGNDRYNLSKIGERALIKRALIDSDVQIGDGVQLVNKKNLKTYDSDNLFIRDGIIVVPMGACIPDGYVI